MSEMTNNIIVRNMLELLCEEANATAKSKGWWEREPEFGTIIALIHSELSEALEYARRGNGESGHILGFSGVEEELADAVIRIFDFAGAKKLRLADAILAKMSFNEGRPYKHGGKEF